MQVLVAGGERGKPTRPRMDGVRHSAPGVRVRIHEAELPAGEVLPIGGEVDQSRVVVVRSVLLVHMRVPVLVVNLLGPPLRVPHQPSDERRRSEV